MQGPLTDLVSQLITGLPASGSGKSSTLQGKEKGAFFEVLTLLSSGTSGPKTGALTGEGNRTDDVLSNLADLLPTLLTSDISDLSQSLQAIASMKGGGIEKSSPPSANNSDVSSNSGSAGKTGQSADLLPTLLTSDISDLSQSLQAIASMKGGGIEKSSPPSANNSDVSSNSGSAGKAGQSVEALLSALVALFGTEGLATDTVRGASDNLPSGPRTDSQLSAGEASTPTDSPASSGLHGTTKGVEDTTISPDNSVDQKDQGRSTKDDLQMLALLVFNSLEAVLQKQPPQDAPTGQDSAGTKTDGLPSGESQVSGVNGGPGQATIYRALVDLERLCDGALSTTQSVQDKDQGEQTVNEADVNKTQSAPTQKTGGLPTDLLRTLNQGVKATTPSNTAPHEEGDKRLVKEAPEAATLPPEVSSEGKGSPSAEISLAVGPSATEGADDKNTLTVAIKTPFGAVAQNGPAQMTGETIEGKGTTSKGFAKEESDPGITTIVKNLSPLLKGDDEGSAHHNGGDKEQPSGQESYPFSAKVDTAGTGGVGQEQIGKASGQPTTTAAVERFQKIIEQFGSGSGQHDLTVKLDMGKEGSVVLGLKDLGPSVTVEVRASDQGIVNLLQSQKDSIIRNLEGKDVHANIFIDPNASGTPDKRDRGETGKQRTFQSTPEVDEGFGEFLDVFA
jgi:hypothetical protein